MIFGTVVYKSLLAYELIVPNGGFPVTSQSVLYCFCSLLSVFAFYCPTLGYEEAIVNT